jgi:predicted dehydrogenase
MADSTGPQTPIAFVGAGFMGQVAHLRSFTQIPDCQVVALAECRPRLRELVASRYHIPRTYETHRELLQDDRVEAVVAILPHTLNDQVACDLLRAGKHVLVEKPMAASLAAAERMAAAADAAGVQVMIGYMKRYDAGVLLARQIIEELRESDELGQMTFVRAHCFGGDWVCKVDPPITTDEPRPEVSPTPLPDWLPQEQHQAFNQFNNVYCHNINLLRFLLDDPLTLQSVSLKPRATLVAFDAGGATVSLEAGSLARNVWDEETKVYFERGWVELRTPSPLLRGVPAQVEVYRGGDAHEVRRPMAEWSWAFRRQAEHFLECVREGSAPRSSGRDSLRDMQIVEDVFRHNSPA